MIRLALFIFKITLFSVIVLVIGQIPVGKQRISDHVRDVITHAMVQRPVQWVSRTFNFLEGHRAVRAGAALKQTTGANDPERTTESDRSRLSGLLKKGQ